jgi:tetratricopeptide (TPR) repeat protein
MVAEIITTAALAGIFYLLLARFAGDFRALPSPPVAEKKEDYERTVEEVFAQGEELLRKDKFAEAKAKFLEVERRGGHPKIHNRLGIVYLETREHQKAVQVFEEAVREDPSKAVRHANLAVAYKEAKKFTLAKKSIEKALELDPGNEKYERIRKEMVEGR